MHKSHKLRKYKEVCIFITQKTKSKIIAENCHFAKKGGRKYVFEKNSAVCQQHIKRSISIHSCTQFVKETNDSC